MSDWDSSYQLCVFDMRRGQHDGHELDKILFFYPIDCPLAAQLSLIGLGEGLITFTKIFSPDAPCDMIDSEKRRHIFFQPEEDIWMIMVIEKRKESGGLGRTSALQAVLKEAHTLFMLFYGSIRVLLTKSPNGDTARSCLHAFLPDYLAEFLGGKKLSLPSYQGGLEERGTMQIATLERITALEVQSLVNLLHSWFGNGRTCHTLLLYQDLLVSTTLPREDAASLYTYVRMRMAPAVISSSSSGRSIKKGSTLSNSSSSAHLRNGTLESESSVRLPSREKSGAGGQQKVFTPRPLQRGKWWRDPGGFLVTDAWGVEAQGLNGVVPTVWLKHSPEECMQLCVYQHKQLTVIMLTPLTQMPADGDGSHLLRNQILEVSNKLSAVEERISTEWGGVNATHVAGYRYLCVDNDSKISKASPVGKVATLTKDSLLSLNKVRAEIDVAKERSERRDSALPYDLETCVRTRSNAWVVVRIRGSNELYIVLERASETLLLTAEATEKFSRRYCDGIFASD